MTHLTSSKLSLDFVVAMVGDRLAIFLAFSFTGGAAQRSELPNNLVMQKSKKCHFLNTPSRRTGLTVDPKAALIFSSSEFLGLAG